MPDDVDLVGVRRSHDLRHERRELPGAVFFGAEPTECRRGPLRRQGSVRRREDAVALVGQHRRERCPIRLLSTATAVHEDDGSRVARRRTAGEVVGARQGATRMRELCACAVEKVVGDGEPGRGVGRCLAEHERDHGRQRRRDRRQHCANPVLLHQVTSRSRSVSAVASASRGTRSMRTPSSRTGRSASNRSRRSRTTGVSSAMSTVGAASLRDLVLV